MTPATLAAYLVPAMLQWVPPAEHRKSLEEIRPQYETYADAIAVVVLDAKDSELPFAGPHRHEMTALLLGSIASYEAHFRADVASCATSGDKGRSWGLWQTQRPQAAVCASLEAGAKIALGMIVESFWTCRHADVRDRLGLYTDGPAIIVGGRCKASWWRSYSRVDRARAYHAAHEIEPELEAAAP